MGDFIAVVDFSTVTLGLLLSIVVIFLSFVDNLDHVSVLTASVRLLSLHVGNEWLILVNVIELTVCETQMVALVKAAPDGSGGVRCRKEEKLGEVENVEELGTVAHVEPHPVTVGKQVNRLLAEELHKVGTTASPPMVVTLILVQILRGVLMHVIVIRVLCHF